MLIYRFRVTSDEFEDFLREIEIAPNHTYLDFHHTFMGCVDMEPCQQAFVYMADKKSDMSGFVSLRHEKRNIKVYDEEMDEIGTKTITLRLLKDTRIKNFIEDPHQKLRYEYFGKENHIFHVELFKISQSENNHSYPRCSRRTGDVPKKPVVTPELAAMAEEDDEKELILPVIPKLADIGKLDESELDDNALAEIAAIDNNLDSIIREGEVTELLPQEIKQKVAEVEHPEEEEEHEEMEHIEDIEDMENFEGRYSSRRGNDSDEL